jgi:predicted DNA binding CopG/RHH family protein
MTNALTIIAEASIHLMELGLEPRSAIKQAAADHGIPYGDKMSEVVNEIETLLGL